jgi:hypothetical protein
MDYIRNHNHGQYDLSVKKGDWSHKYHYEKVVQNYIYRSYTSKDFYKVIPTDTTKPVMGYVAGDWVDGTCPLGLFCDDHPPLCEQKVVKDEDARTETIHHDAVYETVHHDAIYETIHHEAETHDENIIDVPGHEIIVVDTEAWTETIHHDEVCQSTGSVADVTQNVKDVVASGHLSFIFDNAHNPGGIFATDYSALFSTIEDPSYGTVKSVRIVYNTGCGAQDITFDGMEYDVITLGGVTTIS